MFAKPKLANLLRGYFLDGCEVYFIEFPHFQLRHDPCIGQVKRCFVRNCQGGCPHSTVHSSPDAGNRFWVFHPDTQDVHPMVLLVTNRVREVAHEP